MFTPKQNNRRKVAFDKYNSATTSIEPNIFIVSRDAE